MPPARLTVTFDGFHSPIPPLNLPMGQAAGREETFRRRIADHVVRYMYTRSRDDIHVVGHPDQNFGRVEVEAGGETPGLAGSFTVTPEDPRNPGLRRGVPGWLVALVVLACIIALL